MSNTTTPPTHLQGRASADAGPTGRRLSGNLGPGMLHPGAGKLVQRSGKPVRCGTLTGMVLGKLAHPNAKDPTRESVRFLGQFIAVKSDGTVLQGAECYLTGTVQRAVAAAVDMGQVPVPLSIEVWCEPDEDGRAASPLGYSYSSYDRMPLRAADPLLALAMETGVIERPAGLDMLAGGQAQIARAEAEGETVDVETGEILTKAAPAAFKQGKAA